MTEATRPRLWPHVLALGAVLTAAALVVGTDSAFVTDEAYVQIQLDVLDDTGQWVLDHPLPAIDPEGEGFPLHGATEYEDGFTLYGKHPLLIYLYRPLHAVAGAAGLVGSSIAGTVAAAWAAARLAERLRAGSGPLAVWLVGAATPLLFDALVVHGHTLAAATSTLAVLAALRATQDRPAWWGFGATVAALVTGLLRTEGVLFALALAASLVAFGVGRRQLRSVLIGAGVGLAGVAAVLVDRAWSLAVAGGGLVGNVPAARSGSSYIEGRVSSLAYTMLMPGYRGLTAAEALTAVGAVLVIVGVPLALRRPDDDGAVAVPLLGAALLLVRGVLEWGPVPGLLLAACVVVAGLLVIGRERWRDDALRIIAATSVLFWLAVTATQYESGGHTEWGGRYFAPIVPLAGAVAAGALLDAFGRVPERRARLVGAALVGASIGLAVLSVTTVRGAHERNRERVDGVLAAAAALGPATDGGPPIVVTEDDQIPRLARGRYSDARFLLVRPATMERYLERLAEAGVEELLVVSLDPARTVDRLGPYEPSGPVTPHARQWEDGGGLLRVTLEEP